MCRTLFRLKYVRWCIIACWTFFRLKQCPGVPAGPRFSKIECPRTLTRVGERSKIMSSGHLFRGVCGCGGNMKNRVDINCAKMSKCPESILYTLCILDKKRGGVNLLFEKQNVEMEWVSRTHSPSFFRFRVGFSKKSPRCHPRRSNFLRIVILSL